MLSIWACALRPRGPPLSALRSSHHRRQQVLVVLGRPLRYKADFGVQRFNSTQPSSQQTLNTSKLARFLPAQILGKTPQNVSSLRKIFALAKPEKKPLLIAIGLLLMSSAVSMSVPFTVGKLIDFFSSTNPVSIISWHILLGIEISYSKYHLIFLFGTLQVSSSAFSLWLQLRMLVVQCWWDYQVRFEMISQYFSALT